MVYLLKMVIFHGYVSHNQMILPFVDLTISRSSIWISLDLTMIFPEAPYFVGGTIPGQGARL